MIHAIMLCCAILADGAKAAEPTAADRAAYQAAAARAGKNAAAHVQLALWCEAHGFSAERAQHLNLAASLAPANSLARGLLGLVTFQGKWTRPEHVKQQIQDDPKFQALFREYQDRRVHTPQKSAEAQLRLATWCLEKGLKDEAMAHYHLVTRLDPSRDIAWIRLGYKKNKDHWVKPDVLAAHKLEADRQKHADMIWKPKLEKLRQALESSVETRRLKAEHELYQVTDPRAVPMIFKTFGAGGDEIQTVAVELLSQIEGPGASFDILAVALRTKSTAVRERATRAWRGRDPRDVIGWLVNLIRKPFKYEIKPGSGPASIGVLFVEGERFDIRRLYSFPGVELRFARPFDIAYALGLDTVPFVLPQFGGGTTAAELKGAAVTYGFAAQLYANALMGTAIQRSSAVQQSLENDVQLIESINAQINQTNGTALPMLEALTGQEFGADPKAWQTWWADQLGLVFDDRYGDDKPVVSDFVGLPAVIPPHHACFGAGTLVQTLGGPKKIESITLGDRVLAQNIETGALVFRPVLATHRNGPAKTLRLTVGGEAIVATGIHRFWQAGKGWTMARDLKAGDRVRVLGGVAPIESIEPDATQFVFNLTVEENRNFLVGNAGLLVHDFSIVLPVSDPFDRQSAPLPIARK